MGLNEAAARLFRLAKHRLLAKPLPAQEEMERYGADGEDVIYRILRENFSCVIRNVIVPHGDKYLEKDFLVMERGVPVVIEVKRWKGRIGVDPKTGDYFQDKPDGTYKVMKSPVGTTAQYVRCMKEFYGLTRTVVGMVVFADPDCVLELPESSEGILLVPAERMVAAVKAQIRAYAKESERLPVDRILRCTRFYSLTREFCKGLIADEGIACTDPDGNPVLLHPEFIRGIRIDHQPLLLRDKLTVLYTNGAGGVYYNRDTTVTVCCLDGTARQIALCSVRYILF